MNCNLCPRQCGVDRVHGELGYCQSPWELTAARAALHMWEEPVISGYAGSGTVFFSGCGLGCVFCQNGNIASGEVAKTITNENLTDIFLKLQDQGAHNINLVTGGHYVPQIARALERAKNCGLAIPVLYNSGSYELVPTLKMLDGLVDIYLPDMKYCDPALGKRYANASDYYDVAMEAIEEMVRQVGAPVLEEVDLSLDPDGWKTAYAKEWPEEEPFLLMKRGVVVRHLLLPGQLNDSKKIIKALYKTWGNQIFISIMNQYTPCQPSIWKDYPELANRVKEEDYEELVDYAIELGVEQGFIQEGDTAKESFIPAFEFEGLGGYGSC